MSTVTHSLVGESSSWVYDPNQGLRILLNSIEDMETLPVAYKHDELHYLVERTGPTVVSKHIYTLYIHSPSLQTHYKCENPAPRSTSSTTRGTIAAVAVAGAMYLRPQTLQLGSRQAYFIGAVVILLVITLLAIVDADDDVEDAEFFHESSPSSECDFRSPNFELQHSHKYEIAPFGFTSPYIRDEYDARSPSISYQ